MKHALSLAIVATLLSTGAVQAQTTPAPTPAPAAPADSTVGVSIPALSAWLTSTGATVEPVQSVEDRRFMKVTTNGLPWILFLQSCENDVCSDLQFSAAISDPSITGEKVNAWNRDRRFVKAIFEAADSTSPASAVAQFDILVGAGGPEQLVDHVAVWRALLVDFVRTLMPPPANTAPATPPAGN
jgi:hypothetical protein